MTIRAYVKENKLLMDGAMGTYYARLYHGEIAEYANLQYPDRVKSIHKEYMLAGANVILTNTFAANIRSLNLKEEEIEKCIKAGISLAKEAKEEANVPQPVYIAGDIGTIGENREEDRTYMLESYRKMIDLYLEEQLPVLLFETCSDLYYVKELIPYIREKDTGVFVIVSLCVNQNGYTSAGIHARRLLEELVCMDGVDACGLNCGIGSGHMAAMAEELQDLMSKKYFLFMPNAGYPEQFSNRMVFMDNAEYFAKNMKTIGELGAAIVGGCCGTTPEYIKKMQQYVDFSPAKLEEEDTSAESGQAVKHIPRKSNSFYDKFSTGKKVIAVELDPPYDANYEKVIECALHLKQCDVDMITIADSPMGRSRVDSILMSLRIANDTGMPVMPHLCCRDKNLIALRSAILGAYVNKIRNFLFVTGDPVPSVNRNVTTGVFDYHSIRLMQFAKEMNAEHFHEEPFYYGGALNYGRGKIENVIKRMQQKIDAGATYFLTQPIYSDEDIDRIRQIKEQVDTKILCGIMPLVSYRNANFIKNEMTGIHVPDHIVNRYSPDMTKEEGELVGAAIAGEIIEKLSPFADGYYFMLPFNRVSLMDKIIIK